MHVVQTGWFPLFAPAASFSAGFPLLHVYLSIFTLFCSSCSHDICFISFTLDHRTSDFFPFLFGGSKLRSVEVKTAEFGGQNCGV